MSVCGQRKEEQYARPKSEDFLLHGLFYKPAFAFSVA
jgi:hypothetical protein